MKRHRKYRGVPTVPTAEQAPEVFRQNMIEQFGTPDGPTHGGKRSDSGPKPAGSSLELAEKWGLISRDPARIKELSGIYPDLFAYAEIVLEEKRILEFMRVLISRPSARTMWRSTIERYGRAMGLGYVPALQLFREAESRLNQNGTVAQLHEQVAHMAQHLIALGHESIARDGGSLAAQRELRESLKFVAGLAGLGPKLTLELQGAAKGPPAPPVGDPRRGPWLAGIVPKLEAAAADARAELERERDAAALTAGAVPPEEKKRGEH